MGHHHLRLALLVPALLVAACSTAEQPAVTATTVVAPSPTAAANPTAATERTPALSEGAPPVESAPEGSAPCTLAPTLDDIDAAIATLPALDAGLAWVVEDASEGCPELGWAQVAVNAPSGGRPKHVLLFNENSYLGTATKEPYPYARVLGNTTGDLVSVEYQWLNDGDGACCPTGGPSVVRYEWDGRRVTMLDTLPTGVTG